jgi:hypothetical protein
VNQVPEDTLKLFNQCRMTLKLQEYNYGFSSSHDWSLTASKKVIYNDGKFTSFWSERYETGNLTVQLSKLQDVALLVDYLNIYRNSIKIETDELLKTRLSPLGTMALTFIQKLIIDTV